jgi:tripartite-type tricarboxylate transporter receptor subunit TctC
LLGAAFLAAFNGAYSAELHAQNFPDRPLRLLLGQAPGTATDIVARAVAARWGELLGQNVVVDNRPGAGETIAAEAVARAVPDGHTSLFGSIASHGIAPAIYAKLPYDPARDFAPLSLVGKVPNVLVVFPGLPARAMGDFISQIKSQPGKLNYGSTGVGTSTHLGMELLKTRMALDIVHVPYKSGPAAFTDLMAGQVSAGLFNLPSQLPLIKLNRVRALGVTSLKRSAHLPEVPTLDEAGVPGYEVVVWYAMFAPARTPQAAHARLHAELLRALDGTDFRDRSAGLGVDFQSSTPAELARYSRAEIEKWGRVAREAGIRAE